MHGGKYIRDHISARFPDAESAIDYLSARCLGRSSFIVASIYEVKQSTDLQAPIKTFSSLNILIIVVVPITNRIHVLLILVEVHVQ